VELRDLFKAAHGMKSVTREQYDALLERFRAIDPASSGEGGFWQQEFGCLLPAETKSSWWQFWKK
jgi:hypothetical protein